METNENCVNVVVVNVDVVVVNVDDDDDEYGGSVCCSCFAKICKLIVGNIREALAEKI